MEFNLLKLEKRPGKIGAHLEDIDALFSSNYIQASKFIKSKKVLDYGCGTGYGSNFLAQSGAKIVIGIDVNKKMIKKCNEVYGETSNLKFQPIEPAGVLEFNDGHFDVIVSFEVIEHIQDYTKYLKEVNRVLKKGGIFLLSTPNKYAFSHPLPNPIIVEHVHEFYSNELENALKKYFKRVQIYGKHIINKEILNKNLEFRNTKRYAITTMLAKNRFIRQLGRYVPYSIRGILSNNSKKVELSDLLITNKDIDKSFELFAVCRK